MSEMPHRATTARLTIVATALVAVVALVAAAGDVAGAQGQQMPELPDEVKQWLERDQIQRWANMIQTGGELFAEGSCVRCHGDGGVGSDRAPDLTDTEWVQSDGSLQGVWETIFWGVRRRDFDDPGRRFEMNPQGGMDLEWEEIGALAAYVWSLNNGDFLPRREDS